MSELIKSFENLIKDEDMYVFDEVITRKVRTDIESLIKEKTELEERITIIDILIERILELEEK